MCRSVSLACHTQLAASDAALCDSCLASPHAMPQLPRSSNRSGVSPEEVAVWGVGSSVSLIRFSVHVQRPGSSIVALLPVAVPPVPASWGETCSHLTPMGPQQPQLWPQVVKWCPPSLCRCGLGAAHAGPKRDYVAFGLQHAAADEPANWRQPSHRTPCWPSQVPWQGCSRIPLRVLLFVHALALVAGQQVLLREEDAASLAGAVQVVLPPAKAALCSAAVPSTFHVAVGAPAQDTERCQRHRLQCWPL